MEFQNISVYSDSIFVMIRTVTLDDIHKAMKYGVWTSIHEHNEILNNIFEKANEENKKVILFF